MNYSSFSKHGSHAANAETNPLKLTTFQCWGYGFLFVTIINLSSVMGILFFPLLNKSYYTVIMRCMIGLAIGSLSGSALFHLIPQAFRLSDTDGQGPYHNYTFISLIIWLAIWIVMILECIIKIVVKTKAAKRQLRNQAPSNNDVGNNALILLKHENSDAVEVKEPSEVEEVQNETMLTEEVHTEFVIAEEAESLAKEFNRSGMEIFHSTLSLSRGGKSNLGVGEDKSIKTVAWIVIIGDSLHNFIDGVSIGAGFSQSFGTGLILSLAVMCEEFPHELGDFAILINSGLSVKKAILFNFLSALTCYLGLALGIILGEIEYDYLIFAFAAGIFLYVSMADMMPEVTMVVDEVCDIAPKQAWLVLLNHNVGILVGIVILYILATYSLV